MIGYPGSGKTTTSELIAQLAGATHINADYERRVMFGEPTHHATESRKLYDHLNRTTDMLLSEGESVVFDTSFNFIRDRDNLRAIAARHNASVIVVWVKVPKPLARKRALSAQHASSNNYSRIMAEKDFERIASHLQAPSAAESAIVLDGTMITTEYLCKALGLNQSHTKKPSARRLTNPAKS